ncbi:hypothetical protein B0H67DRAFT_557968 [Lasiosphaeris hirsuta]|uniref:Uncharacterized protein n=1 Tax=Lasiosphaeris hirsuta TaxID=260670 RepID=A0AA39ZX97_9PEZI|nr:hypothetical protein B0H67DRAFT_557968 [Lasiosphaeris hirsuta]
MFRALAMSPGAESSRSSASTDSGPGGGAPLGICPDHIVSQLPGRGVKNQQPAQPEKTDNPVEGTSTALSLVRSSSSTETPKAKPISPVDGLHGSQLIQPTRYQFRVPVGPAYDYGGSDPNNIVLPRPPPSPSESLATYTGSSDESAEEDEPNLMHRASPFQPMDLVCEQTHKMLVRAWGIRKGIEKATYLPRAFYQAIVVDVSELVKSAVRLNLLGESAAQLFETLQVEEQRTMARHSKELLKQDQVIVGMQSEIHKLNAQLKAEHEARRGFESMVDTMRQQQIDNLATIQFLREQVDGKRNMWMQIQKLPEHQTMPLDYVHYTQTESGSFSYGPDIRSQGVWTRPGLIMAGRPSQHPTRKFPSSLAGSVVGSAIGSANGSIHSGAHGSVHSGGVHSSHGSVHSAHGSVHSTHVQGGRKPSAPASLMSKSSHSTFHGGWKTPSSVVSSGHYSHANWRPPISVTQGISAPRSLEIARPAHQIHRTSGSLELRYEAGSPPSVNAGMNPIYFPRGLTHTSQVVEEVVAKGVTNPVMFWGDEFNAVFAMSLGVCMSYAEMSHVRDLSEHVQATSKSLWNYMCQLLFPDNHKSGSMHATMLLNEDSSRAFFMDRIVLQHILGSIFTYDGWLGYDLATDHEMIEIERLLNTHEIYKTHERQKLLDRRAALVTNMMDGHRWAAFRQFKVNDHYQKLRKVIGPLIPNPPMVDGRTDAFYDLFSITEMAWELSAKLWLSRLSFSYVWNDTYAKFSMDSHTALNSSTDELVLQAKQHRVKLAVTPGITMRNDMGMNILPQQILKSGVLVMK